MRIGSVQINGVWIYYFILTDGKLVLVDKMFLGWLCQRNISYDKHNKNFRYVYENQSIEVGRVVLCLNYMINQNILFFTLADVLDWYLVNYSTTIRECHHMYSRQDNRLNSLEIAISRFHKNHTGNRRALYESNLGAYLQAVTYCSICNSRHYYKRQGAPNCKKCNTRF